MPSTGTAPILETSFRIFLVALRATEAYTDVMSYTISAPRCMYCQKSATIELTPDEQMRYEQLQRGEIAHIQVAFPEWSADKRELLITGTHPECWDAIFEDDEEEDDYDREDELEDDEDE